MEHKSDAVGKWKRANTRQRAVTEPSAQVCFRVLNVRYGWKMDASELRESAARFA
jgi:hypothetical protein